MGTDKKTQKAGKGSQQIQTGSITVVNNYGITEERVRAIFAEQNALARKAYTEDAYRIADERVNRFEERFMPRIVDVENALPAFSDPAFQFLLRSAQKTAAATEREVDYDLLSELLVCHIQKGDDRKNRASIKHAVEIVDDIDYSALCGLTSAHAFSSFSPVSGNCFEGIKVMNDLLSRVMYCALPIGIDWLDHLDMLGAVRLSSIGSMRKIEEYYAEILSGYVCIGIKKNSLEHTEALNLLDKAGLPPNILSDNCLIDDYLRLEVINREAIDNLVLVTKPNRVPLSDEQKDSLNKIWGLYKQDAALSSLVKNKFIEIWDSFESLRVFRNWWEAIPSSFSITQVGRVLAQTNAKRCDPTLPDLI